MTKKTVTFLLVFTLVFSSLGLYSSQAKAASAISIAVDGVNLNFSDAKPFADSTKRVLVPLRFVSESLGTTVNYQEAQNTIEIKSDSLDIKLVLGSTKAIVNGKEKDIGTQPVFKNSRAYVPLRFVSEALGRRVVWDGANNTAHIWNLIDDKTLEEESAKDWTEKSPAHVGYDHFTAKNGRLTFKDAYWDGPLGPYKDYKISGTITKDLDKKSYQLVKYLAGNEQYTEVRLFPGTSSGTPSHLGVAYAVGPLAVYNGNYYFRYIFPEKTYYQSFASKKVSMRLTVNRLFWEEPSGRNIKLENKLRMSLVSLFGDTQGIAIYNWIMEFYNQSMKGAKEFNSLRSVKKTKNFGNIQVDFDGSGVELLNFYFTVKA